MSLSEITDDAATFASFSLNPSLLRAIDEAGYESPTPVQAEIIPHLLAGRDVIGQAQTGTGKTAAFALPLLQRLHVNKFSTPQVLVLAPTRELALQVAESFTSYGRHLNRLRVAAIFGGQDYGGQFRQLEQGAQVVVGTPGRLMDHIRQGSLKLAALDSLVLDEADEMLKMGFLGDVEWIIEQTPPDRQIALFSATMPADIRAIAQKYLREPVEITIRAATATATTINQRYLLTSGLSRKFEALSRLLESEKTEGVLVFVRTKVQTVELAEQLVELGYAAAPLSGDIAQNQRLRTVDQLKSGKLNILIATDVAARGLDVERISHVINFDVPFDTEAYIHRIGRTGRAGRSGEAILFLNPREKQMLKAIEKATRQKITEMRLPSVAVINASRIDRFNARIRTAMQDDCSFYVSLLTDFCTREQLPLELAAAALAKMVQGKTPLLLAEPAAERPVEKTFAKKRQPFSAPSEKPGQLPKPVRSRTERPTEAGMERYRIEVGEAHGVRPANIVGAIANEADISSRHIGQIRIHEEYSTVDLPEGMPAPVLKILYKARINERMLKISRLAASSGTEQAYSGSDNGKKDRLTKKQGFTAEKSSRHLKKRSGKGHPFSFHQ